MRRCAGVLATVATAAVTVATAVRFRHRRPRLAMLGGAVASYWCLGVALGLNYMFWTGAEFVLVVGTMAVAGMLNPVGRLADYWPRLDLGQ